MNNYFSGTFNSLQIQQTTTTTTTSTTLAPSPYSLTVDNYSGYDMVFVLYNNQSDGDAGNSNFTRMITIPNYTRGVFTIADANPGEVEIDIGTTDINFQQGMSSTFYNFDQNGNLVGSGDFTTDEPWGFHIPLSELETQDIYWSFYPTDQFVTTSTTTTTTTVP